jgi:amino acid permease
MDKTMDESTTTPQITDQSSIDEIAKDELKDVSKSEKDKKGSVIGIIVAILVVVAAIVAFGFLLSFENETTSRIRDVFIIFMALEFLIIGLVLIILVVQLARLTNLLQNEVKPILDSTNETVSTLRGTTRFLSDNLIEPVIKLNEYIAGLQSVLNIVRPAGKKKRKVETSKE